ncbi:uncharacterized protein F4812DRAFT_458815 [Daldinia caldariorum]|uniref:uncharacterized protein n=1 Tax=Daldinia caldariorum TaxID=326644 RepID=UPI0020077826|nr:uncharacterized protein F4812DRAFT_458815 [Daldinia caldariorum]KAI1468379.1 hypothetical protein F4812DRAFT_458815 [Daldinia caldariorum]
MASTPVPTTIAEEYLYGLLIQFPRFAEKSKSAQRDQLRGMIECNEPVGDIRQELSRCLSRHAHFLALDRSSQLQYINHLHFFFHHGSAYRYRVLWPVLFQLPQLSDYIYTTRPGGDYDPTMNSIKNWFLWNLQRRGLEPPVPKDHAPPPYEP